MQRHIQSLILASMLCFAGHASAADPAFVGKYVSTPQDTAAIQKVIADFQTALKTKNVFLLSSLMLADDILFANPTQPKMIKQMQGDYNMNYNGLRPGGYTHFADMILRQKATIEENFYNVRITQDDNTAIVMFDFDFRIGGKVENHGLETWQMMKDKDGKWKIASVFWSSKGEPK